MDTKRRNAFIFQYRCSCSGWLIDPVCCSTWGRSLMGEEGEEGRWPPRSGHTITHPSPNKAICSITCDGLLIVQQSHQCGTTKQNKNSFTYVFTLVTVHLLVCPMKKKMLSFASKSSACTCAYVYRDLLRSQEGEDKPREVCQHWLSGCFVEVWQNILPSDFKNMI